MLHVHAALSHGERAAQCFPAPDYWACLQCHPVQSYSALQATLQSLKLMKANKRRFTILDGLSGRVTPGRMTLLLGPPGSGKSTLLSALAGKLRHSDLQACNMHHMLHALCILVLCVPWSLSDVVLHKHTALTSSGRTT